MDIEIPEFNTLLIQEMINNKILWPSFLSLSYSHKKNELIKTKYALRKAFSVYEKALKKGVKNYLKGPAIKPVFRRKLHHELVLLLEKLNVIHFSIILGITTTPKSVPIKYA